MAKINTVKRFDAASDDQYLFVVRRDLSKGMNQRTHKTQLDDAEVERFENMDLGVIGNRTKRPGQTLLRSIDTSYGVSGLFNFEPVGTDSVLICQDGTSLRTWDGVLPVSFQNKKTDFVLPTSKPTKMLKAYETGEGDVVLVKVENNHWFRMTQTGVFQDLGDTAGTGSDSPPDSNVADVFMNRLWVLKNNLLYFSDVAPSDYSTGFDTATNAFRINVGDERILHSTREYGLIVGGTHGIYTLQPAAAVPAATDVPQKWLDFGIASSKTFCQVGDDYYFLSFDGVRGLRRSINDKIQLGQTLPISYRLKDEIANINFAAVEKACAVYFDNKYFLSVPTGSNTENDTVLVYWPALDSWAVITGWAVSCFEVFKVNGEYKLFAGNNASLGTISADYKSVLGFEDVDNSTDIVDSSAYSNAWTAHGNAKIVNGDAPVGGSFLELDGTNSYISTPYKGVDPYTKLLLHGQGVNGAQTFLDAGTTGHTLTPNGSVYTSSNHAKFGGTSMWFRPANLLSNGSFETWTAGDSVAPDGWTLGGAGAAIAKESTTIKVGTYSAKLTRNGSDTYLTQDCYTALGGTAIRGKSVTVGVLINASVAGRAFFNVNDGVGFTSSSAHTGVAGWQYITVTRTVASAATQLLVQLAITGGDTTASFYGAICVEGTECPEYYDGGGTGYLTAPDHADFDLGASDFDIEVNAYFTDVNSVQALASSWTSAAGSRGWICRWSQSKGKLDFVYSTDGTNSVEATSSSWTPTANTQYQIKYSRVGNTLYYYINGVAYGTSDLTGVTIFNSDQVLGIGIYNTTTTPSGFLRGYLSELRIRKGIGVSAAFTPQTTPYVNGFWTPSSTATWEGWVNFAVIASAQNYGIFDIYQDGSNYSLLYLYEDGAAHYVLRFVILSGGTNIVDLAFNVTALVATGSFYHISVVRNLDDFTLRLNGVTLQTKTATIFIPDFVSVTKIGSVAGGNFLNGSIDEFRYSDIAVYTSDFTPDATPLKYAPITYTWSGTSDNGTAITSSELGKSEDMGQPLIKKVNGELNVKAVSSGDYNIKVYASFDDNGFNYLGSLNIIGFSQSFPLTFPVNFGLSSTSYKKFHFDGFNPWYYCQIQLVNDDITSQEGDITVLETSITAFPEQYISEEET